MPSSTASQTRRVWKLTSMTNAHSGKLVFVNIGHAMFADGRSTVRSTTREPERRWERPRRRGGERDGLVLSSLSSAFVFSEGDFEDMATAATSALMPIDTTPARW
jgi:hypothetical protein